ncbi:carcinoembryonic antigen-related cell adhesion molecule 2-like [Alligator sinensis]|uniref:Carcinoembryonic antigen-related cell adhesion molecule 2-like n=1 Tax=Alligator sinensis TaxID=38654 RepID=A0A3Q0FUU4_ALLSI|nr:carcinoembryonic antigen-related cell adhesion molecule 2-like [Alligator sinensis]
MLSQPKVMLPNPMVVENRTLELTCEAPPSTETLLWDHDGSVLVPGGRVGLSPGNRTLTVQGVCRDDAGNYTCEVRNPVSHNRSRPVTVTVAYGPDAATVAPPGPLDWAVGAALGLTCETGSVPAPRYEWFHNDTALPGAGETLNLTEPGWGQQGTYRCAVHNPITGLTAASRPLDLRLWEMLSQPKVISSNFTVVENRTLKLTCEAPPSTETYCDHGPVTAHIVPPGPLHPQLGDNVTLTCTANSFPAPRFHWSHNGSDLVPALTSAVLSLVLRGAEQMGVFECLATNPHTGRSATASVSVALGPGQQAGSLSGGAIAGIIIGTLVGLGLLVFVFYYFWGQSKRHSKKPVQTGSRTPVAPHGPDVTRSGPLKEEEVSYSSVAFRAGGLQTPRPQGPSKADTTVYAETHITVTPDPPPAPVVGGAVTLTPQPPPQLSLVACTWYRAGDVEIFTLRPGGSATLSHGPGYTRRETGGPGCSLRLGGLQPSDSGPYTVRLGMPGNGHSISVHLAVLEPLDPPAVTFSSDTMLENKTLELTCEAPEGAETLRWLRSDSILVPGSRVRLSPRNRTLQLRQVSRGDAGDYQCEVQKGISHIRSRAVAITVIYGPEIVHIIPQGPLALPAGEKVNLTCMADSVPASQFIWSHSSHMVPAQTSTSTGAVLSLVLMGTEQTGIYKCCATNPRTGLIATTSISITLGSGQGGPSLVAGVVAGVALAALALGGTLAYVLFRHCRRKTPRDSKEPPQVYENLPPPACTGAVIQPGSSPDPTYQTLQLGAGDLYQELWS